MFMQTELNIKHTVQSNRGFIEASPLARPWRGKRRLALQHQVSSLVCGDRLQQRRLLNHDVAIPALVQFKEPVLSDTTHEHTFYFPEQSQYVRASGWGCSALHRVFDEQGIYHQVNVSRRTKAIVLVLIDI